MAIFAPPTMRPRIVPPAPRDAPKKSHAKAKTKGPRKDGQAPAPPAWFAPGRQPSADLAAGSAPAERQADMIGERIARDLSGQQLGAGPLPEDVRAKAEGHLGVALGGISLETAQAGMPERAIAVTRGRRVSFRPGRLDGGSLAGRSLLGHELVHVAQQSVHGPSAQFKLLGDIKLPDVKLVAAGGGGQQVVIDGVPVIAVTGTEIRLDTNFDSTTLGFAVRLVTNGSASPLHDLDFLHDAYPSLKGMLEIEVKGDRQDEGEMAERPIFLATRRFVRFGGGGGHQRPAGATPKTRSPAGAAPAKAPVHEEPTRPAQEPAPAPAVAAPAPAADTPRALDTTLDPTRLSKSELEREINRIHDWLLGHPSDSRNAGLQEQLDGLERELLATGERTDFQNDIRLSTEWQPVYDPDDGTVVGYYRQRAGVQLIVDLNGNTQWSAEKPLETPILDPIDFVPTPGTAVKIGAGIIKGSAKVIGKALARDAAEAAAKGGTKAVVEAVTGQVVKKASGGPVTLLLGALRLVARLLRPAVTAAEKDAVEAAIQQSRKALGKVVVNIAGTGEVAGAINLNPLLDQAVKDVPNLVKAGGERIGQLFGSGTIDAIVSNDVVLGQVNWSRTLKGAFSALKSGGSVSIAPYAGSLAEHRQEIVAALHAAGFKDIALEFGGVVIRAFKP